MFRRILKHSEEVTQKMIRNISTSSFQSLANLSAYSKLTLHGNAALALGVVHAGYHAISGYPHARGLVALAKSFNQFGNKIDLGWSVNEATATGYSLGRTLTGQDCLVTLTVPGLFQAADVVSSSAFFNTPRGALVYLVLTDYLPVQTHQVIDPRPFFSSIKLPILETSTHQSLYDFPRIAADISKEHKTPAVILTSHDLLVSQGEISSKTPRIVPMMKMANLKSWKTLPVVAAKNHKIVIEERLPALKKLYETASFVDEIKGDASWGIIVNGNGYKAVHEAISNLTVKPSLLVVSGTYPPPLNKILTFANQFAKDRLVVLEEGDRYLTDEVEYLLERETISKERESAFIHLTPDTVSQFLIKHGLIGSHQSLLKTTVTGNTHPHEETIDAADPYSAFNIVIRELKQVGMIEAVIGDVSCSSKLAVLDATMTTGISDAIRQGYALSRPENAHKYLSVIEEQGETHTGLDATRNAVFKVASGVKVVLCQTPNADEAHPHSLKLEKVLRAEGAETMSVDAYNLVAIREALKKALSDANAGLFTVIILHGQCLGLHHKDESQVRLSKTGMFASKASTPEECSAEQLKTTFLGKVKGH